MSQKSTGNVASLSFEEALKQLEDIVRSLESGQQPLEESIKLYEQGVALRKHCQKSLDAAKMKFEKLTSDSNGILKAEEEAE